MDHRISGGGISEVSGVVGTNQVGANQVGGIWRWSWVGGFENVEDGFKLYMALEGD